MDAITIESEALKLPESQRAILVDHLQESLSTSRIQYLNEHLSESKSRFEAYKKGEIKSLDGEEFIASLRSKLS